jgi:hypothetical protein
MQAGLAGLLAWSSLTASAHAKVKGDQVVELAERRIRSGDCAEPRTHEVLLFVVMRSRGSRGAGHAGHHAGGQ